MIEAYLFRTPLATHIQHCLASFVPRETTLSALSGFLTFLLAVFGAFIVFSDIK
jgi:hypothetical protein